MKSALASPEEVRASPPNGVKQPEQQSDCTHTECDARNGNTYDFHAFDLLKISRIEFGLFPH
jgi:hypothetical protein